LKDRPKGAYFYHKALNCNLYSGMVRLDSHRDMVEINIRQYFITMKVNKQACVYSKLSHDENYYFRCHGSSR